MSNKNTFKRKFNFILFGAISILFLLGAIILFTILSIKKNVVNSQRVSETMNNLSLCQSSLRGFLLNAWTDTTFVKDGTNIDFEKFKVETSNLENNIKYLKENTSKEDVEALTEIENGVHDLKVNFDSIALLIKERGFKNLGLEGKLREAVHKLENSEILTNKAQVLTLRKQEKDFFLRKDQKYLSNFSKEIAALKTTINDLPPSTQKDELVTSVQSYENAFNQISEIEKTIGLNKSDGLRGEINKWVEQSIINLKTLTQSFDSKTQSLILTTILFILLIFTIIIIVVIVGLNKLIKPVFEPMQEIQKKASEISEGNLSVVFDDLRNNTVLKELIEGFEKIIQKFKTTMNQVEGISSRQILTDLTLNSDKDEVGVALNKIITQIRTIDEEEKRRTWHNEGLAKFANILRINNQDETEFYDSIIRELVKYVNANQGAMFIIEGEEDNDVHLSMKSCYAYDRKKFLNLRVNFSEGLAGACWAEGESIMLTEVPQDYVRITSGLGEATPTSIIIVPIKFNDKIQGVIELASFNSFETYQTKFTESIAENIGSAIHNMKTNTKTMILLQKSQEMTEELRSQEEEMRQNMEELQATQEEMSRMSSNLQKEVQELKIENEELKSKVSPA